MTTTEHNDAPVALVSRLSVKLLSEVVPERVRWLWEGRLPIGKMVALDGDPGLGKSTVAAYAVAIVTTGGTWPDGATCDYPGDVILLAAEDGLADTIRPRLDAAGADCTRVHAVEGVAIIDEETGERHLRPPTLADVDELHKLVVQTGARLLVIDVLMAYLPTGVDSHKDQDVRRVLSRLAAMAEATGCTVLLLRHLNKATGKDPMYRGGGSIGIVGAVRSGLLIAADPNDPELRVMVSIKSNLGPAPDALTYRLVSAGEHGAAKVQWEGTSEHDARTLLAEPDRRKESPERDTAEAWLKTYLAEHSRAESADVKAAATVERFSKRTLQRAAQELGIKYVQDEFRGPTFWYLPDGAAYRASQDEHDSRLRNSGAIGDRGAVGPDQQVSDASQDADSLSALSRHDSETRHDWQHDTEQTRPDTGLWLVSGEPVDGDR